MSVYPVLTIESLERRCHQDIETFITQVLDGKSKSIESVRYELYTDNDYDEMMTEIGKQLSIMKSILHNKTIKSFDYAHDVPHFQEQKGNQLWILRTLLCYQMMIFGTHVMSDPSLHQTVYKHTNIRRPFRPNVVKELPSFKLGIFGSITRTSDIDIGIQYSGMIARFTALDYVVGTMEDMFIIFLGIQSTLQLDIEYYADMMTLPNPNSNSVLYPDLFYLDTSSFTETEFDNMRPYAYASIYRNYQTAKKALGNTRNEIGFIPRLESYGITVDKDVLTSAIKMVDDYMRLSYAEARKIYYKLVLKAEKQVAIIRRLVGEGKYDELTRNKGRIVNTMKAIAHALVFRAESYVCAPTVMHVVRLLQAAGPKGKYPVTYPAECLISKEQNRLKNPQCEIGWFGYEMSKLEQIGYILRFQMAYCESHKNDAKCTKKLKKYQARLDDAIARQRGVPKNTHRRRKTLRKNIKRKRRHTRR